MYIPDTYPYEKRGHYPHMKPADRQIWERFIDANPTQFDYCQYSVPCGASAPFDTLVDPATGSHDEYLYKRKIDVVAFKKDQIYVIELKPRAGSSAVGQVKMYRDLYIKDYSAPSYPNAIIITDSADPDVFDFAKKEGIILLTA